MYSPFRYLLLLLLWLASTEMLLAQNERGYADAVHYDALIQPDSLSDFSFVDNDLWITVDGLMLHATNQAGDVVAIEADARLNGIDKHVVYVVRQPVTNRLFYVRTDRRGNTLLYEQIPRDGKSPKSRRIKLGRVKRDINHPVFSSDGRIMVFSSNHSNMGGSDLWYSIYLDDGIWSTPYNLGGRVNSAGDEVQPFIAGNYLFFSSRHRDGNQPRQWQLYATRLVSSSSSDTVGMHHLGQAPVQQLPSAFNQSDCNHDLVVDTLHNCNYWMGEVDGKMRLCSLKGSPEGFLLNGTVSDPKGKPLANVEVQLMEGGSTKGTTKSDRNGAFSLVLQAMHDYVLHFSAPGYYVYEEQLHIQHRHEELLQSETIHVQMDGFTAKNHQTYVDIFGDNGDIRLADDAAGKLHNLRTYLNANPQARVLLTLCCNRTSDRVVNEMLNERRVAVLRDFFADQIHAGTLRVVAGSSRATPPSTQCSDWLVVEFTKK